jgi:hypothetical protein
VADAAISVHAMSASVLMEMLFRNIHCPFSTRIFQGLVVQGAWGGTRFRPMPRLRSVVRACRGGTGRVLVPPSPRSPSPVTGPPIVARMLVMEVFMQVPQRTMVGPMLTAALETFLMRTSVSVRQLLVKLPVLPGITVIVVIVRERRHCGYGQPQHCCCYESFIHGHRTSPLGVATCLMRWDLIPALPLSEQS